MLSRAELVALSIAILAAAAGAFGGKVVGFILFAAAFIFVFTFVLRLKLPRRAGSGVRPYTSP